MEFEKFKEIVDLQVDHHKRLHALYELKVDVLHTFDELERVVEMLWGEILTDKGADWLSWFLYEKDYVSGKLREDMNAWDGEKEICKDLKGLYAYLKDSNYFLLKNQ
jgi:hypothetical protein